MRVPISDTDCDYCNAKLSDWDYRYLGKHYCKKCYNYLFHFKICSVCKRKRKIYYDLKTPVCKFCQVKDKPCIRCGKTEYTQGKITEQGPVCNSCAKYFTEHKKCTECTEKDYSVSMRNLADGTTKLICQTCFSKTLPICSSCGYRRKAFSYLLDKTALCEACSVEITRKCTQCGNEFPAGKGRICPECTYNAILSRKTQFIANSLSIHMSKLFHEFSGWLNNRRGVLFASLHIHNYQAYFLELDDLCEELNRLPTYKEIVAQFTVAKTRFNLLVTIFFNEKKIILVDKKIQEEYANLDMIDRYLHSFLKDTYNYKIIHRYYDKLNMKYKSGKTTIRSIRLALTPAVKFLKYCKNFNQIKLDMNMLSGYLWYYPGQQAAITGFINFLSKEFKLNLSVRDIKKVVLRRPSTSKAQLEHRLIDLLRSDKKFKDKQKYLFKTAIGYLHGIEVSDNIFIDFNDIKIDFNKDRYIRINGNKFYLPTEVIYKLK